VRVEKGAEAGNDPDFAALAHSGRALGSAFDSRNAKGIAAVSGCLLTFRRFSVDLKALLT